MPTKKKDYKALYEQSLKTIVENQLTIDKLTVIVDNYEAQVDRLESKIALTLDLAEETLGLIDLCMQQDYTLGQYNVEIQAVLNDPYGNTGIMFSDLFIETDNYVFLEYYHRPKKSVYIQIDTIESLDILGAALMIVRNLLVEKENNNVDGTVGPLNLGVNNGDKTTE